MTTTLASFEDLTTNPPGKVEDNNNITTEEAKYEAVRQYLKEEHDVKSVDSDDVCPQSYDDCTFELEGVEILVLTESEKEERWDETLENYIDECILHELPEQYRPYFDTEKWKRDARFDGAGHHLSGWNGQEHEYKIGDEWIYIYRQN